jgi:hypothetical protein
VSIDPIACLNCRRGVGRVRGLCAHCYNVLRKQVVAGETTWAALEAAGKCQRSRAGEFKFRLHQRPALSPRPPAQKRRRKGERL